MKCAINSGYYDTKAYNGRELFKFRTKIDEASEIINSANTARITYEGHDYIIGEGAAKYSLEYDKTLDILHKLSTYYALSRFMDKREDFSIMVALPLNVFSTLKSTYEEYLMTDKQEILTVNGQEKHIRIVDCKAFPEGVPALYANDPDQYRNDTIGILDIGSLTVNGCVLHNLNLIKSSVFTTNLGTTILYNQIKKELNGKFLLNIQDYEMQNLIYRGLKYKGNDATDTIRNIIKSHVQMIVLEMRKNEWNIDNLKILLTGGGSLLLQSFLSEMLPNAFLGNDPIYDNVLGLYEIGRVMLL